MLPRTRARLNANRARREASARQVTLFHNYQRAKNAYNALVKRENNLNRNISNQFWRLHHNPAYAVLFPGVVTTRATLRNRVRTHVPKTVNTREFARLYNAHMALFPNLHRTSAAARQAAIRYIRAHRANYNNTNFNNNQVFSEANRLGRKLKYNKGKIIGRIIGNRVTNPYTGIGRRMIMKRFPVN